MLFENERGGEKSINKKLLVMSVLAVFMLLAISFASTVSSNTPKSTRKKSPLFKIRIRKAIQEKISGFITRFVSERVFFLPFHWLRILINQENLLTAWKQQTCRPWCN